MLRLRPKPTSQDVAIVAVNDFDALPALLRRLGSALGGRLTAFEVMWTDFYELVTTPPAKGRAPVPLGHPYYVLIESLGADAEADAAAFEAVLGAALEAEEIVDAALAKSQAERDAMWGLRDDVAQVARDGPVLTYDVSLGVAQMQTYVAEVGAALEAWRPGTRMLTFGHLGDGNLHLIVSAARSEHAEVDAMVYRPLHERHGSISAEHGIGLEKKDWLWVSRSPAEIAAMKAIKQALDPLGILNPGKIF
jgi:FAD/FMN-containing dehydrogenase